MELIFNSVTKFYGAVIGVNDISCRFGPGITGLLGANGAGKSTMMKLASGQLRPTLGQVLVGGASAWSAKAKQFLGFSPDINNFYEDMSGREFVLFLARLHGYSRREARERTERVLADVGMSDRAHRRIAGYSHGMRQRTKLAQAMVNDPDVLLLDEPLTGIDPGGRHEMNGLFRQLADRGKTLLVSSHLLQEVEQLADTIVMISAGRILASGKLADLRMLLEDYPFTVEVDSPEPRRVASLLVTMSEVSSLELRGTVVIVRTRNPAHFFPAFARLVVEHELDIGRMETVDAGAEAVFDYLQRSAG